MTAVHHINYPTYQEWSLTVEQQLTKTAALSVGYVGNHTYHQPIQASTRTPMGLAVSHRHSRTRILLR